MHTDSQHAQVWCWRCPNRLEATLLHMACPVSRSGVVYILNIRGIVFGTSMATRWPDRNGHRLTERCDSLGPLQFACAVAYQPFVSFIAAEGQANDALVGQTQLFGNKNISDSIWQDQLPFYREYGPITKITAYKATEYDNLYHDPGELKGFQFW